MFYLSIIFILVGIFIFFYSLLKGLSDRMRPINYGGREKRGSTPIFLKKNFDEDSTNNYNKRQYPKCGAGR